jgi:uncharacterized protein YbaR (Trm112 family)
MGNEGGVMDKKLLDILACPKCKGDLEYDKNRKRLLCHRCKLAYPVKNGIPVMLIDEAEKFD